MLYLKHGLDQVGHVRLAGSSLKARAEKRWQERPGDDPGIVMDKWMIPAIYVAAMVATIVSIDIAFFKDRMLLRLLANVGVVLVFGAFYLRFFRNA
ncbi:MAG: hypothetical protein R3C52_16140 [Hyphomonadaceae bacterium]